jgi:hypothetical protein
VKGVNCRVINAGVFGNLVANEVEKGAEVFATSF